MIKKLSVCSPAPGINLLSQSSFFRLSLQRPGVAFSFAFTLFCLLLSISGASAQTRQKRTGSKSEERLRRVDNEELANEDQSEMIATLDSLPDYDIYAREMPVACHDSIAVINIYSIPVAFSPSGDNDNAVGGDVDRSPRRSGDVLPFMKFN